MLKLEKNEILENRSFLDRQRKLKVMYLDGLKTMRKENVKLMNFDA